MKRFAVMTVCVGVFVPPLADPPVNESDSVITNSMDVPLVVDPAVATMLPMAASVGCQTCDPCGSAYHKVHLDPDDGAWRPRPAHTGRSHSCSSPWGTGGCEDGHEEACNYEQDDAETGAEGLIDAAVAADPLRLAQLVAANPRVLSLDARRTALYVRGGCNGEIIALLPLTGVAQ